jgi:hypothetical protein
MQIDRQLNITLGNIADGVRKWIDGTVAQPSIPPQRNQFGRSNRRSLFVLGLMVTWSQCGLVWGAERKGACGMSLAFVTDPM